MSYSSQATPHVTWSLEGYASGLSAWLRRLGDAEVPSDDGDELLPCPSACATAFAPSFDMGPRRPAFHHGSTCRAKLASIYWIRVLQPIADESTSGACQAEVDEEFLAEHVSPEEAGGCRKDTTPDPSMARGALRLFHERFHNGAALVGGREGIDWIVIDHPTLGTR